ncbi:DUF4350 domain-containing protein [Marinigracilibium pacificum]|uniref:DUF4350 domain-containing protein n=1 Tax=Marinigracilibium pacificum TaxID=2729599 RepID=A0A848ITC8_9BACT|nr:DUF4350 domain-containing protein [Marinigracilibium pacificum]NMM47723.1 DUF4350 domain-containing protein [Marinigracilibium pacificum]
MRSFLITLIFCSNLALFAQQIADSTYSPVIKNPAYPYKSGPVVFIDEGHFNFHTKNGRYKSFATLLERDGYKVREYSGDFKSVNLLKGKILVISNALNEQNQKKWHLPTPSAFTRDEIQIVKEWVFNGGSLFLIADHMPMAGAAEDLASAFGFKFTNGFVFNPESKTPDLFNTKSNTLHNCVITKGRNDSETVDQIATFTGQAFQIPEDATSILTFDDKYVNYLPDTAWVFDDHTQKYNVNGWSQGAYKQFGKGKVVVFGEAAMFSAQLAGPQKRKVGMNNSTAPQNYQLLLNIIHWLDDILD